MNLSESHSTLIKASAITDAVAEIRGYRTATTKAELTALGFGQAASKPTALVIPLHGVSGELVGNQIRPDNPRYSKGKPIKYETPYGWAMRLDVHPTMLHLLGEPESLLVITEGIRKGDAAVSVLNVPAISLLGVWNFRGKNDTHGMTILGDWQYVHLKGRRTIIAFDSDVVLKPQVQQAMRALGEWLDYKGSTVAYVKLPDGPHGAKVGLDDFLAKGYELKELLEHSSRTLPSLEPPPEPKPERAPARRQTFEQASNLFRKWLDEPDCEALAIILATVVANRLSGDPVWLFVIGPPSSGKTEMITALEIFDDCHMTSSLTPASFLSGTATKERTKNSTGGRLREIGDRGILLNKDFGSVLTLHNDTRAVVLQILRDVYDGSYVKDVGTDGGQSFTWKGHCGFIAGTTDAIDIHHSVVAAMGDRYLSIRMNLGDADAQAEQAITEAGSETTIREELSQAVAGVLDHVRPEPSPINDDRRRMIAQLATLVVSCRSAVIRETGHSRDVLDIPETERPARFGKQLARLFQGLEMIGFGPDESWSLIVRVAMDSMPRGRLAVLNVLFERPVPFTAHQMGTIVNLPTTTAARHLDDLRYLRVLDYNPPSEGSRGATYWLAGWVRARWPVRPQKSPPNEGSS